MRWQRSERQEPDINLTPLIDVVFLLLIFFMVSTTFQRESQISIELPKAQAEEMEQQQESLEIIIDEQGRYYVNDRQLVNTQMGTLMRAIRNARGDRENPAFIITADARTPHQAVVKAMDAARQMGFTRLSIATRKPDTDGQ